MVDVHFDNQVLRLTSGNCEAKSLLENIFQNETVIKSDKFKKVQNGHQNFACILRYDGQCQERIVEDFELIPMPEETKFHIEIKECPLKYEFLRRPSLVFPEEKCYFHTDSTLRKSHESCIQDYFKYQSNVPYKNQNGRELRLKSKLHWTFIPSLESIGTVRSKKSAEFLLKSDPKLGGVLLYSMKNFSSSVESQIGYFIFVVLSECDLHFQLPNRNNGLKGQYKIIFKPKSTHVNYDYLSINKEQSLKAIIMDSRSEFLAWFSALRWAKSNHDLTVAFHNPQTTDKKNVCLSSKSFKSKIRGINNSLVRNSKNTTKSRAESSLSWSESLDSSSSTHNDSLVSHFSTWSLLSSSDSSSRGSPSVMLKKPKQVCALLSDIPHEAPTPAETPEDSFEEEESIYVPVEMSSQGCEIITDPDMIKQTDIDSFIRSRFRNIKGLPLYEPWFAKKCLYEVECLLLNHYHIDGYFLVRPEFQGENVFLVLSVVFNEGILHYKIIQKKMFYNKHVFCLEHGSVNFPSISALIDFYKLNLSKPLPCYLTESPLAQRSA